MSTETSTMEFQAEVQELLQIMIHSLYSHKEIFLRELISNASDALDKRRFEAVTRPEWQAEEEKYWIRLDPDPEQQSLTVSDNGIGMSRDEVVQNIGTIARSGTRKFLEELRSGDKAATDLPQMIGQFGVGFYSCFMVADEVELLTRKVGESKATLWQSEGDGRYRIEEAERDQPGTTIRLHFKEKPEPSEGETPDFTEEWTLRNVVRRYSDFVEYPIEMEVEKTEGEGEEAKAVKEIAVLNSRKPLWTRDRSDISEEEYQEFYRHLSHDWQEPMEAIHFRAEGTHDYTALLYLPKQKAMMPPEGGEPRSRLQLFVKRILIDPEFSELLPPWLRFIRGLVDSEDLPLNISRETLQHNRQVGQIRKRLVNKVLDALAKRLQNDRETYLVFWSAFGPMVKEGIYHDDGWKEKVAALSLFQSSAESEPVTLAEYIERMPEQQKEIYYLLGEDSKTLASSPHLEAFQAKGMEVLLLTDPVDAFAIDRLHEFEGKPLKSAEAGEVELESEEEKEEREKEQEARKDLLKAVEEPLQDWVGEVRLSNRLQDSPAVLVADSAGMNRLQEKLIREISQQDLPASKRILELNPKHPVVQRLFDLHGSPGDHDRFEEYCQLLYGQALLAEGSSLPDPAKFSKLLSRLLVEQ
ncbi:MAG: molecular chaperone HtpG [Planctomycetota bacterium]|nr:MAG: molecular chaperone HtpG [Planctomycetota bacterium]